MSKSETAKELKKGIKKMIVAFVLSIIACAVPSTILLIQIVGGIARNLANRHYDKYHNFDTIWWNIEYALDRFML